MGFFSLPLARIVGETGRVFCVDMQEKMIGGLRRRVAKAGLLNRIELRVCSSASLQIDDLTGMIDFALAFAVVHETSDAQHFLSEIYKSLKGAGRLLISEPKGHVNVDEFDVTLSTARNVGFKIVNTLDIKRSHSILLEKD
jgi:ubiquinone/menaquinone biosynthesis C-methylase UbiE